MDNVFEQRGTDLWPDADLELRSVGDGLSFEGYALVWNTWSEPIPGGPRGDFREQFAPNSLDRTLARDPDIVLSVQHSLTTIPLGRTSAGTFSVQADDHGLLTKGELPDNELGRPVRDAIKRRDMRGMSIRFRIPSKQGEKWSSDFKERTVTEAQLGPELSVVTFPAYPVTTATVRHLAEEADLEPDVLAEAFKALRDPDARLTVEQRDALMAAINVRVDAPYINPTLADMQSRFASAFAQ